MAQHENWEKLKYELGSNILAALNDTEVIEIMLNEDGLLWIEKLGQGIAQCGQMEASQATMIIYTMAYSVGTVVDSKNPIISGELPVDGSRFQGMIPPVVTRPIFSIRKRASKIFTLKQYVENGILTQLQYKNIVHLVKDRKNILVVGATGSGKTTFGNALLNEIEVHDPETRMIIIEDTRELQCDLKNKIVARTTDTVSMQDLLKSSMRLRPDRICIGEVRGGETYSLLMAWNTGHNGGIATIHANNAYAGIKRIEQILTAHNYKPVPEIISEAIHAIVSIQKTNEGRRIQEILSVSCERGEYIFNEL